MTQEKKECGCGDGVNSKAEGKSHCLGGCKKGEVAKPSDNADDLGSYLSGSSSRSHTGSGGGW